MGLGEAAELVGSDLSVEIDQGPARTAQFLKITARLQISVLTRSSHHYVIDSEIP